MLPRYLIAGVLLLGAATAAGYFYGRQHSAPVIAEIPALSASPSPTVPITPPQVAKDEIGRTADEADDEHRRQARYTAPTTNTFVKVREAHVGDETVKLSFKSSFAPPRVDPNAFVDDRKSGGFFAPLAAEAAAGSDAAARHLYEALQMCRNVPLTPQDQEAQRKTIRDGFAASGGGDSGNTLEQNLAFVQLKFDRCAGVMESMFVEARGYLRDAADRGDANAGLEYAAAILKDQPDEARQRLEVLWQQGHVTALAGLGLVGKDPLAYKIAFNAQHIAQFDPPESPNAAKLIEFVVAQQNKLRNETSPSEYNEAAKRAVAFLRNPACCLSP